MGVSCEWIDEYNASEYDFPCSGPSSKQCWTYTDSSACQAVAGCSWGMCEEQGCWDSNSKTECEASTEQNTTCKWNTQYNYCYKPGCWDYTDKSTCEANSCKWDNQYCSNKWCSDFSGKNESFCVNNTASLNCKYEAAGNTCTDNGCWNVNNEASCNATSSCIWETYDETGWCEEVRCWSFDGTDNSTCVGNNAGLRCTWDNSTGNEWCYEDFSAKSCTNYLSEKQCLDTFYCMWNTTNCLEPGFAGITTDFNQWNPGCYIFDGNETLCNSTLGCTWDNPTLDCNGNSTIQQNGLSCGNVNSANLCNTIPALGSCCSWVNNTCQTDRYKTTCWDSIEEPPAGAAFCEDYKAFTDDDLCAKIAGSPWFMPCRWNNGTARCEAKLDKIFTEGKENIMLIDNKQNCEYAGGKWITESYCEGATAVPTGRCELKFDEERNCDKSCFACEYKTDGTNWSTVQKAKDACTASKLGVCEFTENSGAPNGLGSCNIKQGFKNLGGKTCDDDCGACAYTGDPTSSDPTNRPSAYCAESAKGCKWLPDPLYPTDESKGKCTGLSEKTCNDKCDKCIETNCEDVGAKKGDSSLSKQCSWSATENKCNPLSGGDQMETCFDGIDNNNNGDVDCADSMCFSDPFCGGDFFSTNNNCWNYNNDNETCIANDCNWVEEAWGSWCDIPGANCWKFDTTNESVCEGQSGCQWYPFSGNGQCEENWEKEEFNTCFNFNNQSDCTGNCTWIVDTWCQEVGGRCETNWNSTGNDWKDCWQVYGQWGQEDKAGCIADPACNWVNDTWCQSQGVNTGWCDHVKFSCWNYKNETSCTDVVDSVNRSEWCEWRSDEWGDWCQSKSEGGSSCWNVENESTCTSQGCNWLVGLCDPIGFGGQGGSGGGFAQTCFKYTGNETACTNTTGCGWFPEPQPFCDVDFSSDCPQYWNDNTSCINNPQCEWKTDGFGGGWCDSKIFNCFQLNDNASCTNSTHCTWSGYSCEPSCFVGNKDESACGAVLLNSSSVPACRWTSGWCDSGLNTQFFKDMEGGEPVMLGVDPVGDASTNETDIIGLGMKDMGNAFGFGIPVVDLANAAVCNNMNLRNGGKGAGKNTTKFFWYLDADGDKTNNCAAKHNISDTGYEFYFTYAVGWDQQSNDISENMTSFKCSSGSFVATDIKLSVFRNMLCNEIGGGMVAVEKTDLEKFTILYNASADLRVSAATAGDGNNITSVSDYISPGFATPGAIDFSLDSFDLFKMQGNNSNNKGQDNAFKGFVQYDADCWTSSGCSDYSCMNHPYCVANSLGVHAAGFEDTRMPKIKAITRETYRDAALINYFTDKPANGTLHFYSTDSTCTTENATIYDTGINNSYVRDYRLPHVAEIYNDGGADSLPYALSEDTKYYFKLEICDEDGKCGKSACSSFKTETTASCGFCNFVTRLQTPAGWVVSYDLDQDGTYEHVQGEVCGVNAGMKTNYSTGRAANILLKQSDNTSWIEFKDARLTKTGLGSKISNIQSTSALAQGTTTDASGNNIGYVGMVSDTRDKIINNLYPEQCLIKIPGTGSCTELWHCNDELTTCVDRTDEATLNETGSDYCIWEIPFCEFSVWAGGQPSTNEDNGGGGSGGGGGGGGGGSSGGGGGSSAASDKTSRKMTWTAVRAGQVLTFKPNSISIPVDDVVFTSKNDISLMVLEVIVHEIKPGSITELENSFNYLEFQPENFTQSDIEGDVEIKFSIEKSWVDENAKDKNSVYLYKYFGDTWNRLETGLINESEEKYTYKATTAFFSYYAIAADEKPEEQAEDEPEAADNGEGEEITFNKIIEPIVEKISEFRWWIVGAGMIVFVILLLVFHNPHKHVDKK
ncbi:TPA: PGF-pre-PGF domain-containing protein [Candidatus Woesearchaeota archaeon]|nr:PGF-pre-PGF domain-containing protein [Candidatus Woesearchaeota archaeon]HIH41291.1 PGF-pre-PGF domain-containing protein [Candidatus Woesearchaeota archaeon]